MSHTNTCRDFSEKAERTNRIPPLAYESSNHEPFTYPAATEKEETMNTTQNQIYNISLPHPLAELLLNILARTSVTKSDYQ